MFSSSSSRNCECAGIWFIIYNFFFKTVSASFNAEFNWKMKWKCHHLFTSRCICVWYFRDISNIGKLGDGKNENENAKMKWKRREEKLCVGKCFCVSEKSIKVIFGVAFLYKETFVWGCFQILLDLVHLDIHTVFLSDKIQNIQHTFKVLSDFTCLQLFCWPLKTVS